MSSVSKWAMDLAAMLAIKTLIGVALKMSLLSFPPDISYEIHKWGGEGHTLALQFSVDIARSSRRGISGSIKRTNVLQELKDDTATFKFGMLAHKLTSLIL